MEELYPSEIARLVLGYLKESKCEKTWKIFLEESSNLHEHFQLYKRGKLYTTNVNGKSLLDILNEYCILKRDAGNHNNEFSESRLIEKGQRIFEEIVTNAVEEILLKYLPSICDNSHLRDNSSLDMTKAIQTSELRVNNCIEYGNTAGKSGENNKIHANNENTAEISSHNFDSSLELNVTDSNINQSEEQSSSEVNARRHSLSLIESSVSDSIYLQEIIKVEKDDSCSVIENSPEKNISDIPSHDIKQEELSNDSSQCYNDLTSKNKSKVVVENLTGLDSISGSNENADKTVVPKKATDSMEVEIIKTIKVEPNSETNCKNKITGTNCFQNSSIITSQNCSSTVEISQTALCDTQSTVGQFSNLVNNVNFSTNQPGYALQTTSFSNQPITVNDLSFPSVPTYIMPNYSSDGPYMQNNAQYSFVINTPTSWKEATVGGFSLNLPSVHSSNLGPVLTSVDSIRSNSTPSVATVCISNALSPAITAVEPVVSSNTSSVPGISINTISSPALTTIDTAVGGQSLTVSSVPTNVSSFVNAAGTVHAVPNSNLVTSDKVSPKSSRKLKNKNTSVKKPRKRKDKSELHKEKDIKNKDQSKANLNGKDICTKRSKRKPTSYVSSSLALGGKETDYQNSIPINANPQLQSKPVQPKKITKRKGK